MTVTIHYCKTCHFERPARAIAEALKLELGIDATLKEAFWGTFRVEHDGQEIFNRWKTNGWLGRIGCGRTPKPPEIVELMSTRLDSFKSLE